MSTTKEDAMAALEKFGRGEMDDGLNPLLVLAGLMTVWIPGVKLNWDRVDADAKRLDVYEKAKNGVTKKD